ncbi:daunorubicin C-13 ketoreductase [Siphonobacter sp. BAB-5405]|uniref:daunorubicin C-13 ketoreductase n=1 Tax=Siphonobacter sp. BAB-5405 TaxID=1864825 RepID=UPI0018EBBABC|nr:daunorubicin C-13 ketoreductase [Siphonobacter sp. BAB-5405]
MKSFFMHRNQERADQTVARVPGAGKVLVANLAHVGEIKALAFEANTLAPFDAVIHNAGIYQNDENAWEPGSFSPLFTVNSLAPYLLTCLIEKPKRLVYLSSSMHAQGKADLPSISTAKDHQRPITYADTKLHDLILAMAVARQWKEVYTNAVDPGWVPTKMGGVGAPDNLEKGFQTQVWLAVSTEAEALVSGHYFHHQKHARYLSTATDVKVQEKFLAGCREITGISLDKKVHKQHRYS